LCRDRREAKTPQGKISFIIRGAPHRPITPRRLLRLAYSGPPIIKTPADILAIIRQRTADVLTADELALVIKLPALPAPEAKSVKKAAKPPARARNARGRFEAKR